MDYHLTSCLITLVAISIHFMLIELQFKHAKPSASRSLLSLSGLFLLGQVAVFGIFKTFSKVDVAFTAICAVIFVIALVVFVVSD